MDPYLLNFLKDSLDISKDSSRVVKNKNEMKEITNVMKETERPLLDLDATPKEDGHVSVAQGKQLFVF